MRYKNPYVVVLTHSSNHHPTLQKTRAAVKKEGKGGAAERTVRSGMRKVRLGRRDVDGWIVMCGLAGM